MVKSSRGRRRGEEGCWVSGLVKSLQLASDLSGEEGGEDDDEEEGPGLHAKSIICVRISWGSIAKPSRGPRCADFEPPATVCFCFLLVLRLRRSAEPVPRFERVRAIVVAAVVLLQSGGGGGGSEKLTPLVRMR